MNTKIDTIKFVAPVFLVGAVLVAATLPSLKKGDQLQYQPNPLALEKSPYGRTVGMALQGPITRFWDRGVGSIEKRQEVVESKRPDEKLFKLVTDLREAKTELGTPDDLGDDYSNYAMARIEKKLSLAWKMDPRNFSNYAIYQMFLWERFNENVIDEDMGVRELSMKTLETSLSDQGSPLSLLTAGQAAYDIIFAARTSKTQEPQQAHADIKTYSKLLPEILDNYEKVVSEMQVDGRWASYSEAKKMEFGQRKTYLETLNKETKTVVESLTQTENKVEGDLNS